MLAPKLRFKDDNGREFPEWESNNIRHVIHLKNKKYNPQIASITYPCIELENISQGSGRLLGYFDSLDQKSIKNFFEKGDILFGKLRPYLRKYFLSPFTGVCSTEVWVLSGKKITNSFLYQYIQTDSFMSLTLASTGSKMPRADWKLISQSYMHYPKSDLEQTKVANFLTTLDTRINQQEKQCQLLEQYKKGMMQQLFSQKLRFKGDNGEEFPEWKNEVLGNIVTFSKGKGISKVDISETGKTPCIRYGELYTCYNTLIDDVLSKTNVNPKELVLSQGNEVVIPASGETQIDIATVSCIKNKGIAIGGDINILTTTQSGLFLAYYLASKKKLDIAKLAQGNAVVHLYAGQLSSLNINVPSLLEQTKIAHFLSTLDNKITLAKQQLEQLNTYKKGLLQQLFI